MEETRTGPMVRLRTEDTVEDIEDKTFLEEAFPSYGQGEVDLATRRLAVEPFDYCQLVEEDEKRAVSFADQEQSY